MPSKVARLARILAASAAGALLAGSFVVGGLGTGLLAVGASLLPVALMGLGAVTHGRLSKAALGVLGALAVCLGGTLAALILLHRTGTAGSVRLLILLAGLWLVPMLLTGLGYAALFPRAAADDDEASCRS